MQIGAKNDYTALQCIWINAREKVRSLQSEHQRSQNQKKELLESIDERRAGFEAKLKEMETEFESGVQAELAETNETIDRIEGEYANAANKLKNMGAQVLEALSKEVQADKGSLAAGLSKPNGEADDVE